MSSPRLERMGAEFPAAYTVGAAALAEMPDWLVSAISRFDIKWHLDEVSGCHIWTAKINDTGYGRFRLLDHQVPAHRFAYEVHHRQPIAAGAVLDHLCRVRHCVNPAHMEPVTQAVNVGRSPTVGRWQSRKTHCKRGHEFTDENTYLIPRGGRSCRTCQREHDRARRLAAQAS